MESKPLFFIIEPTELSPFYSICVEGGGMVQGAEAGAPVFLCRSLPDFLGASCHGSGFGGAGLEIDALRIGVDVVVGGAGEPFAAQRDQRGALQVGRDEQVAGRGQRAQARFADCRPEASASTSASESGLRLWC